MAKTLSINKLIKTIQVVYAIKISCVRLIKIPGGKVIKIPGKKPFFKK